MNFLSRIDQLSSVLECHHVTGDDDYWAKARVKDTESLDKLLNEIKLIPGVIRTRTTIALATKKEKTLAPSGGGHD
jgi:Lrp/AsnC family leucine-responsive transcriptional regulator